MRALRTALSTFRREEAGNFAMMAALAAVPLLGAVGLAVDYATMSRTHVELQQALDAAVLAVAQRGDDISDAEARRIAASFLTGNLAQAYRNMVVERDGTAVKLSAQTSVPLAFAGLFGYDKATVGASSTADMAFASYEIALVLDTTGSMEGGKLAAMKDAVIGLIDDLSARVDDKERLKFALVPFATFVNVGPQFGPEFDEKGRMIKGTGAQWLDLEGKSPIPELDLGKNVSRFEVAHHLRQDWKGCVETRMPAKGMAHDVDDTPAVGSDRASLFPPAFAIDEPSGYQNDYIASNVDPLDKSLLGKIKKLLKYGLLDAAAKLGNLVGLPGGSALPGANGWAAVKTDYSRGKGPAAGCDMQPIMPLSNDYEAMKRKVNELVAAGNTDIMEGVAWGMRVLSPHEPFSEGEEPRPGLEKIMIVLTDGANNIGPKNNPLGSSYSSFGYLVDGRLGPTSGGSRATTDAMNEKTLQACKNAKEKWHYEIYTIRLEEPDVKTGTMLQECASPGNYFDSPSRRQLDDVFKQIRDGITKLRLSS